MALEEIEEVETDLLGLKAMRLKTHWDSAVPSEHTTAVGVQRMHDRWEALMGAAVKTSQWKFIWIRKTLGGREKIFF